MISHKHKCIFIHIPKCAGTSIEKTLGHFDEYSGYDKQDHRSIKMLEPANLTWLTSKERTQEVIKRVWRRIKPLSNPKNRYTVSKEEYANYFKFTIVRNPWARAYSWYKNAIKDDVHLKKMGITSDIEFCDFVESFSNIECLRPQTFWIKNFNGEIPLDFIGRFENLAHDFKKACALMNIKNIELPHELKGDVKSYQNEYDTKTRDLVKELYREEIELFGYTFNE
ncbi:MAG: sulfotransferase family 2 domain-containing protein [Draconibacterium sp.]